jgi:hypothetical protein
MSKIKKLRYTNRILSMFVVVFVVSAVAMIGTAAACHDWGDAPDPTYPTNGNSGARHGNSPSGYYLGASVDWDGWGGHQSADATGDDNYGNDDEDGVTFVGSLTAGSQATVQVTASTSGYLNAWMDFNRDGDWADTGEQIFTDMQLTAGLNTLTFDVSPGATTGTTFARFRFCSVSGMCSSYGGNAADGEVEDYMVDIKNTEIPEFSSIAIPVVGILGLMFFFNYRKRRRD